MSHPALSANNVAVITGGASGIGLAAAMRFARLGLRICIADVGADKLSQAAAALTAAAPAGAAGVMTAVTDVSNSMRWCGWKPRCANGSAAPTC